MLRRFGHEEIPTTLLVCGDNFDDRLKQAHVGALAKSIREDGVIHPPVVRQVGDVYEVICGEDRVAAHVLNGVDIVVCDVVEADDALVERLRATENAHRRTDPREQARLMATLVDEAEAQLMPMPTVNPFEDPPETKQEKRSRGRPKGTRSKAREVVSNELGKSPEAVRKADERARKRAERERATAAGEVACPIPTVLDIMPSSQWNAEVGTVLECLKEADKHMKAAQGALTRLRASEVPFPAAVLQRLTEELHAAAVAVRGARPASVCPYCKLDEAARPDCLGCNGTGWVREQQMDGIPDGLAERRAVLVGGLYRNLPDPRQVEMFDGVEVTPSPWGDPVDDGEPVYVGEEPAEDPPFGEEA